MLKNREILYSFFLIYNSRSITRMKMMYLPGYRRGKAEHWYRFTKVTC